MIAFLRYLRFGFVGVLFVILLATTANAQQRVPLEARKGLVITFYQSGFGLVEETRFVPLRRGETQLRIEGVSRDLIPSSLRVKNPSEVTVQSMAFQPASLSAVRVLKDHVGKEVLWIRELGASGKEETVPAKLLAIDYGIVLELPDRIEVSPPGRLAVKEAPAYLLGESVLDMTLIGTSDGGVDLGFTYLQPGLGWEADYVADYDAASGQVILQGFVTLKNDSESRFEDAVVRLIAGDVAAPFTPILHKMDARAEFGAMMTAGEPQAVSDRYAYDPGLVATIAPQEARRFALFEPRGVAAEAHYRFSGLASPPEPGMVGRSSRIVHPDIRLSFTNQATARGENLPLPGGQLRVYETLNDGPSTFLGADSLPHTPTGEKLELRLGTAFDITGQLVESRVTRLSDTLYEAEVMVRLRNAKPEAVDVELVGFFAAGWSLEEETHAHEVDVNNQLVWKFTLPAHSSEELRYRARLQH